MPITVPEPVAERGKKDARRHREKQREAIKKQLPEIISTESIITRAKGKAVRIPIRSLDIPHFRPGRRQQQEDANNGGNRGGGSTGIGQGSGDPGDVIDRRPGSGPPTGSQPGQEPGQEFIESEIELEELISMMLEDLGLPSLKSKEIAELEVISGTKIRGIQKSGPRVLLDSRRSSREAFGRFFAFLQMLMDETGRDELVCSSALKHSDGDFAGALELLDTPDFCATEEEVEPFAIYHEGDLRFHRTQEDVRHESNAVVLAMMDVSGSMTTMKKYIARSLLFWLVEFLRTIYLRVEIRFIIHHTNARLVPEEEFFRTVEGGGTRGASAYELANSLICSQYPTNKWNVYAFHFSDGEDFAPQDSMREAQRLISQGINMFGYGEIHAGEGYRSYGNLLSAFKGTFPLTEQQVPVDGATMTVSSGAGETPFLGVVIESREQIWPALKEFLKIDRWSG